MKLNSAFVAPLLVGLLQNALDQLILFAWVLQTLEPILCTKRCKIVYYMYILYQKEKHVGAASFRKPVNNKMHQHPSKSSTDQYGTYVPMVSDGFHRTCKRSFSVAAVTVDR